MPRFLVVVKKKIEYTTHVEATDAEQAKALAYANHPEHLADWHCDVFNGTKYTVKQAEG